MNKDSIKSDIVKKRELYTTHLGNLCSIPLMNFSEIDFKLKTKLENGINALSSILEKLENYTPGDNVDLSAEKEMVAKADEAVFTLENPGVNATAMVDRTQMPDEQTENLYQNGENPTASLPEESNLDNALPDSSGQNGYDAQRDEQDDFPAQQVEDENYQVQQTEDSAEVAFFSYVDDFCNDVLGFNIKGIGDPKIFKTKSGVQFSILPQDVKDLIDYCFIKAENHPTNFDSNKELDKFYTLKNLFDETMYDVINFSVNEMDFSRGTNFSNALIETAKDKGNAKNGAIAGALLGGLGAGAISAIKKNKDYNAYAAAERAAGRTPVSRAKWVLMSSEVLSSAGMGAAGGAVAGSAVGNKLQKNREENNNLPMVTGLTLPTNDTQNTNTDSQKSSGKNKWTLNSLSRPAEQGSQGNRNLGILRKYAEQIRGLETTANSANTSIPPTKDPFTGKEYTDAKEMLRDMKKSMGAYISRTRDLGAGVTGASSSLASRFNNKDWTNMNADDFINVLQNSQDRAGGNGEFARIMQRLNNKETVSMRDLKNVIRTSNPEVKALMPELSKFVQARDLALKQLEANNLTAPHGTTNPVFMTDKTIKGTRTVVKDNKANEIYGRARNYVNVANKGIEDTINKMIAAAGGNPINITRFFSDSLNFSEFLQDRFMEGYLQEIKTLLSNGDIQ